jgi:hypothetical protein
MAHSHKANRSLADHSKAALTDFECLRIAELIETSSFLALFDHNTDQS